jgi:ribosome-binding protein aMBF1 (putative translation factor)
MGKQALKTWQELISAMRCTAGYAVEYLKLELTEAIYRHMEKQKMSREELAARLGKSTGYVTKLMRGELSVESVAKVADALGCTAVRRKPTKRRGAR